MAVSSIKGEEVSPPTTEETYKVCTGWSSASARLNHEKEDVYTRLATVLIIRTDSNVKTPVVTLQGEKANIYLLLERHIRPEYLLGGEKFWRLVKGIFNLENWRPRVNGIQLKALQGARLPETEAEWHNVKAVLEDLVAYINPGSTPDVILQELKDLVAYCEDWWDNRTKRENAKRPADSTALPAAKRVMVGLFPEVNPNQLTAYTVPVANNGGYVELMTAEGGAQPQEGVGQTGTTANSENPVCAEKPKPAISGLDKRIVTLNVGGRRFPTTCATLAAVEGSYLWKLATSTSTSAAKTVSGEFFIDRSGKYFEYILEYLRATRFGEEDIELPLNVSTLKGLLREAVFYKLPGLEVKINNDIAKLSEQQAWPMMDSFYIETGYHDMNDGHYMHEHQAQVMQELNAWVDARRNEGYAVDNIKTGVHHQVGDNGHRLNNLYYHVLFRRIEKTPPDSK